MIQQTAKGLNSRSEANPYNEDGFLPIITAPMYSVVDESNYQVFLDNKIQVCLPRKNYLIKEEGVFESMSLEDFKNVFINSNTTDSCFKVTDEFGNGKWVTCYICIDTANGNISQLHEAIRKAKEIHGDKLVIMAGNVASVEAFVELAKTGVDYIRVGIGGGAGCNTTSNTGVGQEDLEKLIKECKKSLINYGSTTGYVTGLDGCSIPAYKYILPDFLQLKTKIVADGISSYIKQCETKYGFNDNGYAAINKLLFAGADLVMIGKLFVQCLESAGEKKVKDGDLISSVEVVNDWYKFGDLEIKDFIEDKYIDLYAVVKYSGMSTQEEQVKYKNNIPVVNVVAEGAEKTLIVDRNLLKVGEKYYYNNSEITITSGAFTNGSEYYYGVKEPITFKVGEQISLIKKNVKPSEGSVNWIPVRWSIKDWLEGDVNQDTSPFLMGYINSLKSAMSYTGKTKL